LQADQIDFVRRSMNMSRNAQFRRVTDDLVPYGGYYGLRGPQGFYPLYKCGKGQRIGRYAVDTGVGTLIGALLGGKKGAAIGGGLGAAVAVREDLSCWAVQNNNVQIVGLDPGDNQTMVVQSPMSQVPLTGRENGWNQRLRDTFSGGSDSAGCLQAGLATLHNASREILGVFVEDSSPRYGDKPLEVLVPGQRECADPDLRYEAWIRQTAVSADGWVGGTQHTPRRPEAQPGMILVWR